MITKIDLADTAEFDAVTAHASIQSVRPGMQVFEVSAKTGAGMDVWLEFLTGARGACLQAFDRMLKASSWILSYFVAER